MQVAWEVAVKGAGYDGVESPINAVWDRRCTKLKPSQIKTPIVFSATPESHHGYSHPVPLVPPGLPKPPLWPLNGRTSQWLATNVALLLVLPLDTPFVHALDELARQWTQWGIVYFTWTLKRTSPKLVNRIKVLHLHLNHSSITEDDPLSLMQVSVLFQSVYLWCCECFISGCSYCLYRCAWKRIATSFIWMWSISPPMSCLSMLAMSSSQCMANMKIDRLEGP